MRNGTFKAGEKYEFNKKEKGICVFIVSDKARMPYNMFLDRIVHKNCRSNTV